MGELYSNNDPTISLFGEKRVNRGFEASFVGVTPNGEINIEDIALKIKRKYSAGINTLCE